MSDTHGMMTADADGRMLPTEFVVPANVLRGTPDESGHIYLSTEDGSTVLGVWECGAYAERLVDYPYNEMCTLIEGAVEITADGGEMVTYRAGDTFFMAKGFTGLWESHGRFKKFFMVCAN
nr:cupin domain-containing protein [uncultured Gellertiella sp.]